MRSHCFTLSLGVTEAMRSDYKRVWMTLSESLSSAKIYVSGTEDEAILEASVAGPSEFLLTNIGIKPGCCCRSRSSAI
jgi:hypothetical protein